MLAHLHDLPYTYLAGRRTMTKPQHNKRYSIRLQLTIFLVAGGALGQQIAQMPNVYFVEGTGGTYANITAAYGACPGTGTCEIWDYALAGTETMASVPWNFDNNEVPVHLHLGPGILSVSGPFVVPRNSTVEGAGRAIGSGAGGTIIQASGSTFGGVAYVNTSGVTCSPASSTGTVTFSTTGGGSGAAANWSTNASGVLTVKMTNPGGGYGHTTPPTVTSPSCLPSSPTAVLSTSVVILGDTNTGVSNSTIAPIKTVSTFGSRLVNLTVDCNNVPGCTAIEMQNDQEQGGPMFVNAVNYSGRCLWVHGMNGSVGTDNSFAFQIECNGYYAAGSNSMAGHVMTTATVPVEFDNTKSRGITGATVNPVFSSGPIGSVSIACTSFPASASIGTPPPPANWNTTTYPLPYGLSAYVLLSGYSGTQMGWNTAWPISNISLSAGTFNINGSGACPTSSASGGSATLIPSADIIVCSGSACAYGGEGSQTNPTQVSLTQIHTEHAGNGYFITGADTSVEILAPTVTTSGTVYTGLTVDSVAPPTSVNISSMLANTGVQFMIVDGITNTSIPVTSNTSVLSNYLSGTAAMLGPAGLQPPLVEKTGNYSLTANDSFTTFDNSNAGTTAITYTLPTPAAGLTYTFMQSLSTKITIQPSSGAYLIQSMKFSGCADTTTMHPTLYSITPESTITIQAVVSLTGASWCATSCAGAWAIN
jgi:hypothetical protein